MDEELIQISEEIFAYIRSQLTFHLRFMDLALNNYQLIPDALEYRCDGKFFHYPPIALIKTFQNNPNEMVRGYLHVVLHSVFQHLYFSKNRRMSLWNLAADIAVENVIEQLGLSCTETPASQEKQRQIAKIREKVPEFTAQKIYHYLEDLETDQIKLLAPVFYFDNHECWYEIRDSIGTSETLYGEENRDNPSASGGFVIIERITALTVVLRGVQRAVCAFKQFAGILRVAAMGTADADRYRRKAVRRRAQFCVDPVDP